MGHVKHVQNILRCLYCCWPAPVMPFHKELRCPHIFPHRSWWATINSSLSHLQLQRQVSQHLNQSVPSFVYIFPTFGIYFQSKPPSHGPALRTAAAPGCFCPTCGCSVFPTCTGRDWMSSGTKAAAPWGL